MSIEYIFNQHIMYKHRHACISINIEWKNSQNDNDNNDNHDNVQQCVNALSVSKLSNLQYKVVINIYMASS